LRDYVPVAGRRDGAAEARGGEARVAAAPR
jgi:hypothetical protein